MIWPYLGVQPSHVCRSSHDCGPWTDSSIGVHDGARLLESVKLQADQCSGSKFFSISSWSMNMMKMMPMVMFIYMTNMMVIYMDIMIWPYLGAKPWQVWGRSHDCGAWKGLSNEVHDGAGHRELVTLGPDYCSGSKFFSISQWHEKILNNLVIIIIICNI